DLSKLFNKNINDNNNNNQLINVLFSCDKGPQKRYVIQGSNGLYFKYKEGRLKIIGKQLKDGNFTFTEKVKNRGSGPSIKTTNVYTLDEMINKMKEDPKLK